MEMLTDRHEDKETKAAKSIIKKPHHQFEFGTEVHISMSEITAENCNQCPPAKCYLFVKNCKIMQHFSAFSFARFLKKISDDFPDTTPRVLHLFPDQTESLS